MLNLLANVLVIAACVHYFSLYDKWYFYLCLSLYCIVYTLLWAVTKIAGLKNKELEKIKKEPIQTKFGEHVSIQENELPEDYLKKIKEKVNEMYEDKNKQE